MLAEDILKAAHQAKLRYITDSNPGFKRLKNGTGYKYFDVHNELLRDPSILERVNGLVIPPAWKNVWISPSANTHLQATGLDERGRKQYIYHSEWIRICQENKFNKMIDFGKLLPKIRKKIKNHMQISGLARFKVLATIIWLLENTFIRVGNEEYARENKSFGLTTLRSRHVQVLGPKIRFEFKGKSGISHLVDISNPQVARTIKKCIELPGFQLFQCIDEEGKKHCVDSEDVNEYLHELTGEDISAKDFRTWGGTVLSAVTLNKFGFDKDENILKKNITSAVKEVAHHLRNTPSICRRYYIHPTVIKTYTKNILIPHFMGEGKRSINGLGVNEIRVLTLLEKYS